MRLSITQMAVAALFSCALGGQIHAETLATIAGKPLTDAEFKKEIERLGPQGEALKANPTARKRFLDQLITIKLLEEAGNKEGMEKSKEFQERMDMIKRQVLAQQYMENYVGKAMTEAAVAEHFKKNMSRFSGEEVCAAHILMPKDKKAEAEKVFKDALKKDADFAALAKANSTDSSAAQGGDLGCFGRGRMVPEFEAAAFSTKKGAVHDQLVESQFGYHIIKVGDVKAGKAVKFEDVKPQVEADIERTVRNDLVEKLKKDAKVDVNEKALESMKL